MFAVARVLNKHRDLDFFHAFDPKYVASFMLGQDHAHKFDTEAAASIVADIFMRSLPCWYGTTTKIEYIVIPL